LPRHCLYEKARHEPLRGEAWDPVAARSAIDEIVEDAAARFDPQRFWAAHPLDEGFRDGSTTLYAGAAGVIWALNHLGCKTDFRPLLPRLLEQSRREYAAFAAYPRHASLLMGEVGPLLLAFRLAPSERTADALNERVQDNVALPPLELMWGMPGTMLASRFMGWRPAFRRQAEKLLGELHETQFGPLWIQELYGRRGAYLGPVHGFAGQMLPLLAAWDWLEAHERERLTDAIARTLTLNAWEDEEGVNWPPCPGEPPYLVQYCHGAPGIAAVFADCPFQNPELDRLLARAGDLIWRAGPLTKGSGLCHGTAGNGYAFLKLHRRFGAAPWLERARAFAAAAIGQWRAARRRYGHGRYSLWTGDLGLAIYLFDCLRAEPAFPSIDVF
jgi:Lanthionine synthetase C-like protein